MCAIKSALHIILSLPSPFDALNIQNTKKNKEFAHLFHSESPFVSFSYNNNNKIPKYQREKMVKQEKSECEKPHIYIFDERSR